MIDNGFVDVEDIIDNKGLYYNPIKDNVLFVKLNTSKL